jgi:hypothetical protein
MSEMLSFEAMHFVNDDVIAGNSVENLFRNTSQPRCQVALNFRNSANLCPFRAFTNFGKSQKAVSQVN